MAFQCVIVTPELQVLDIQAKSVVVPAHDGLLGILTDRSPILVKLGLGPLTVDFAEGNRRVYFIDGGVAQMKDNVLTIATTEATAVEDLDEKQAETELADATAGRLGRDIPADLRERSIRRARTKLALAK